MAEWSAHPVVYEINTWIWLKELSQAVGRRVTLATVPQGELRRLAHLGFDAVWLMGVWQRSPASNAIARNHPDLQAEYHLALEDFDPAVDVVGSPYAVYDYKVDPALGGDQELAVLRERLAQLGLNLILDFGPNHLAVDHAWLEEYPERFVHATPERLETNPGDYFQAGDHTLAHGRDPFFPGWTDTVQLDYRRADTRRAMIEIVRSLAARCDGLRCDMAMLVTQEVFARTWGGEFDSPAEFWPQTIAEVQDAYPGFLFMGEVYWDLEYELQQQGFDYTYDKRLYDRLVAGQCKLVREHIELASYDYQRHLVRFIENHDEERALVALGHGCSRAAAVLALTLPGLRLVHDGQMEGRRIKLPVQLGRRSAEIPEPGLSEFYRRLLGAMKEPVFHEGAWEVLEPQPVAAENATHQKILAHAWTLGDQQRAIIVNMGREPAQCFLPLDLPGQPTRKAFPDMDPATSVELATNAYGEAATDLSAEEIPEPGAESAGEEATEMPLDAWLFRDVLAGLGYRRDSEELDRRGLFVDLLPHGYHLFDITKEAGGG
jgi:hypothetical protein